MNRGNYIPQQGIQFKVLNDDQCREIVAAACRVLEYTGCDVHHTEARNLLKDAGCRVDGNRVHIPGHIIEEAVRTAPSRITIYDQLGKPVLYLGAHSRNSYFVTGMENQHILDLETEEKRLTTAQDVANAAVVADALPNIDVISGMACVSDCDPRLSDVYETRELLKNTTKPILIWSFSKQNYESQLGMCAEVAGGWDNFLAKPFVITGASPATPLAHPEDALEKALHIFRLGIPSPYIPSTMLGGTAPVTLAGSFVMGLADTLTGLVIAQLANRGCPFIAATFTDMLDMSNMSFAMSAPEFSLGQAAMGDIFRYLDLPYATHLGATDSPVFDQQAAFDIGTQLFSGLLSGANLNYFIGYLETAMSASLECLVFGDEAVGYLKEIIGGVEVTAETLAEEAIHNVGPSGNFLGEEHTMRHFRERWMPGTFVRASHEKWLADGRLDYKQRAKAKVRDILAAGVRQPLTGDVSAALDNIVRAAEKKL